MTGETARPLRADARRNRAKVLQTAYEVFAAEGLGVPIDEIARRAGVGAGTVYRHFPTKEALYQAIVVARVEHLVNTARELAETTDPGEGFFSFFDLMTTAGATDKGLVDALAGEGFDIEAAMPEHEQAFKDAMGELLVRAQAAGAVRADVTVADVKTLMVGCQAMQRYGGDAAPARVLEVVREGLRPAR
ncbi:TetR/AcrR family transcriptional regulator [Catellatospora chokoriensis]|uniref:Putative transcriptional regulatory protein TetR n=1 Tax=Catellatospora chokoriensis TaxID=310353 RepID=A0A8J3K7R7_9ACTN|nr:TetR/AcrR family transcriptional regulator [Catellatospora chokoriensis]GIF91039.1 putative transcriptional regulatory protein TetR [Catellatospora chokoriensis]